MNDLPTYTIVSAKSVPADFVRLTTLLQLRSSYDGLRSPALTPSQVERLRRGLQDALADGVLLREFLKRLDRLALPRPLDRAPVDDDRYDAWTEDALVSANSDELVALVCDPIALLGLHDRLEDRFEEQGASSDGWRTVAHRSKSPKFGHSVRLPESRSSTVDEPHYDVVLGQPTNVTPDDDHREVEVELSRECLLVNPIDAFAKELGARRWRIVVRRSAEAAKIEVSFRRPLIVTDEVRITGHVVFEGIGRKAGRQDGSLMAFDSAPDSKHALIDGRVQSGETSVDFCLGWI